MFACQPANSTLLPKAKSLFPVARLVISLAILLALQPSFCGAAEPGEVGSNGLQELLAGIRDRVDDTRTVQSTFEQERNLALFTRPIIFTGKLTLSRPDKLRWENIDPVPSVLIFAGEKGLRCNDDSKPVHFDLKSDPIMRMVADQIWTWVDGEYADLQDRYAISLTDAHEITLVPHSDGFADNIRAVRVHFDPQNLQPDTIHILEKEGDSTTIRFRDYILNQPVDDILFATCSP